MSEKGTARSINKAKKGKAQSTKGGGGGDDSARSLDGQVSTHVQSEMGGRSGRRTKTKNTEENERDSADDDGFPPSGQGSQKNADMASEPSKKPGYKKRRTRNVPQRVLQNKDMISVIDTHLDHSDSYRSLEKIDASVSQSNEAQILPY